MFTLSTLHLTINLVNDLSVRYCECTFEGHCLRSQNCWQIPWIPASSLQCQYLQFKVDKRAFLSYTCLHSRLSLLISTMEVLKMPMSIKVCFLFWMLLCRWANGLLISGSHVPTNGLMAHPETQPKVLLIHNQQSGSYLERTFGKDVVELLLFLHPSDPSIKTAPRILGPPVHIVEQKLFVPYDRTKRACRERSQNLLPSPTFLKSDDGTIGVRLGCATQGQGLDINSNYPSPVGDRQTLQLKIWVR